MVIEGHQQSLRRHPDCCERKKQERRLKRNRNGMNNEGLGFEKNR